MRAVAEHLAAAARDRAPFNTTLGVVATDAALTKAQAHKLAGVAHDGLARAVRPSHLMSDGDTFFALATGTYGLVAGADDAPVAADALVALNALLAAAADVVTRAIVARRHRRRRNPRSPLVPGPLPGIGRARQPSLTCRPHPSKGRQR